MPDPPPLTAAEPTAAYPPLSRWIKRSFAAVLVLLLILAPAWLLWGHMARQKLDNRLAMLRSRGEPIYLQDFTSPPIPDTQNAATYFKNAMTIVISQTIWSPASSDLTYKNYPPFPPAWHTMADQAIAVNQQALTLTHRARAFDRANWQYSFTPPPFVMPPIDLLNQQRALANLLGDAALNAQVHGDDDQAISRLLDFQNFSASLDRGGPVINRLVAAGVQALLAERIAVIAANLRMQGSTTSLIHPPSRKNVVLLIQKLLEHDDPRPDIRYALAFERMCSIEGYRWFHDHATVMRPVYDLEVACSIDNTESLLNEADQTSWPAVQALSAASPNIAASRSARPAQVFPMRNLDRYFLAEWRVAALRRAAVISLAVQLYRADHSAWPPNLNVLVPDYLPSIPTDPLRAGSPPFGYILFAATPPTGLTRPMLYFDTPPAASTPPSTLVPPNYPCFGWINQPGIQWVDISNWYPITPATDPSSN